MRNLWVRLGIATLLAAMLPVAIPRAAWAQAEGGTGDEVTPTGKGIVGCALLGGEAALLVEAAIGVRNGWALGLIPLVTAGGGGVGGYFLEQSGADPELSVAALVAGMALIIPTTIIVLKSTATAAEEEGWVEAPEDAETDEAPAPQEGTTVERTAPPPGDTNEPPPPEEAPAPSPEAPAPEGGGGAPPAGPSGSLLQLGPGRSSLALGIPSIGVVGAYSTSELRRYGLTQRSELRVGILSVPF